jgi:hypothetical protein
MKRKLLVAITSGIAGAALALVASWLVMRGSPATAAGATAAPRLGLTQEAFARAIQSQPNTASPMWKALSEDVGVMLRDDDTLGLRARLYVRVDELWLPVATDGPADALRTVPAR